ncbi:MAG: RICIN domain-containing protein [Mogibacterium sp.]|nr:RICIN domain-containing protein [Mogibacterium sp.]
MKKIITIVIFLGMIVSFFPVVGSESEVYAAETQWLWPVPSSDNVTQPWNATHGGLDIGGEYGCEILASKSGTVFKVISEDSSNYQGYGLGVVINHGDGYYSHYAHMSSILVNEGQYVSQGQVIGAMGETGWADGVHLHFAIKTGNQGQYGGAEGSINNDKEAIDYIYSANRLSQLWGINDGDTFTGKVKLWAKRTNNDSNHYGVFYIDGQAITGHLTADSNGFFSCEVDTAKYGAGEHTLTFKYAYTDGGNEDTKRIIFQVVDQGTEMSDGYARTIPDGDYLIANAGSPDKTKFYYLDIFGTDLPAANTANVDVAGPLTGEPPAYEVWSVSYENGFYTIMQKGTNMSLDVLGKSVDNGANIAVSPYNGGSNQKWAISRNGNNGYRIQSKISGYSVDVYGGTLANGTNVQQLISNSYDAQSWLFIPYKPSQPVKNGKYVIVSAMDENIQLGIAGTAGSVTEDTNVQICNNPIDSRKNVFNVNKLSNGYYSIIHEASGKSLDLTKAVSSYSANIALHTENNSVAQQWSILSDTQNDGFIIRVKCSGHAIDIQEAKTDDGANVLQYPVHYGKNQAWKFIPAEYDVSYDANGGVNAPESQIKHYRETLSLRSGQPTRSEYSFSGWNTKADGSGKSYASGANYTAESDVTLYAQWVKDGESSESTKPEDPVAADEPTIPTRINRTVSPENPVAAETVEKQIKSAKTDSDTKGSSFNLLRAKGMAKSKNKITVSWKKVSGAKTYVVYGNRCGKGRSYKKLKEVTGTRFTHKGLRKGTYYKYIVVAVDGNKALAISKTIHVATKGGKVGNVGKVTTKAKKNKVSIKKGKTFKLAGKQKAASKKLNVKKHRVLKYETSNKKIATVSSKGVIKGKKRGTCYVYAYAQNGVFAKIKVTVK